MVGNVGNKSFRERVSGLDFDFGRRGLLRSLAVICGHSSGRVSCGHLRSLAATRDLAKWLTCGHFASLAVTDRQTDRQRERDRERERQRERE